MASSRTEALLASGLALLLKVSERKHPARPNSDAGLNRLARNLTLAIASAFVVQKIERPLTASVSRWVERNELGLVNSLGLPRVVRDVAAFLLLDYTLYRWHALNHHSRTLWRFHHVHHVDEQLDVTTAVRFHFGELALSIPVRLLQILVIGARPAVLDAWRAVQFGSVLFHHSNVRLPESVEARVNPFFVTPALHGLHHARDSAGRDTNFSSLFVLWDRLHGTYAPRTRPQLEVGVNDERDPSLSENLALPFR